MAGLLHSDVARPLISEAQAEANGIEVHLQGSHQPEVWRLPRGLFSRSLLLRKLAEWSPQRECFVVRPRCEVMLRCLRLALDWPRSPVEVTEWRQACDYLLLTPTAAELAFAVAQGLDAWLDEGRVRLVDCASQEALQLSRHVASYGALKPCLLTPELAWAAGYDGYGNPLPAYRAAGQAAQAGQQAAADAVRKSLCCDAMAESGLAVLELLPCLLQQAANDAVHLKLHAVFDSTEKTLLALTNTAQGSLQLLENVAAVGLTFGCRTARHLVHRCLCCLYLAEGLGETERCAVSLEACRSLQTLYKQGWLDLSSLLPLRNQGAFLLPGLLGAQEVPELEPSAAAVYDAACAKVPWLQAAMACPQARLHLTGSFLCWCRTQEEPREQPPPGDVDLFCAAQEELAAAAEHVGRCMLAFARSLLDAAHVAVETAAPNAHRRTLRIRFAERLPELARRGLALVPKYALQCDVYVNSLAKVMQYHLPQVRCALFLQDAQPQLFVAPSAAVAWTTMLNVDYCAIKGAKTPFEIIAKGWLWGFNVCLSQREAQLLLAYLRRNHARACAETEALRRPARIVPHNGAPGEPWHPFRLPAETSAEPQR